MSTGPDRKLLMKYAMDQCTPEEKIFVEDWLKSDPDARHQFEKYGLLFNPEEQSDEPEDGHVQDTLNQTQRHVRSYVGMVLLLFILILIGLIILGILKN